jgi:hypothetical protein
VICRLASPANPNSAMASRLRSPSNSNGSDSRTDQASRSRADQDVARAITGNDLIVGIEAENDELIARVACTLDGFELGMDELDPTSVSYERDFSRVGNAGPHVVHKLKITVTDPKDKAKIAVRSGKIPFDFHGPGPLCDGND